jgi:CDP-6-deoxy-D-xylo-4-hexulose-3-dehydrase
MSEAARGPVLDAVHEWFAARPAAGAFVPGETPIPPSGKVIGEAETRAMVEAALDGWLTTGRFNAAF